MIRRFEQESFSNGLCGDLERLSAVLDAPICWGGVQDMTGKIKTDGYKRVLRRSGVRLAVSFTQ